MTPTHLSKRPLRKQQRRDHLFTYQVAVPDHHCPCGFAAAGAYLGPLR